MWETITGFFKAQASSLLIYAAVAAFSATSAAIVTHRIDHGTYVDLQISYEKKKTEAVQLAKTKLAEQDKLALDAAVAEAAAQQKIVIRTITTVKEVPRYVTDTSHCITYGLVRVLDGSALGVDPADLQLPAGQSDDACAPVTNTALAESVAANYGGVCRQNAEQLNALESVVAAMIAAGKGQ